MPTLPPRDQHRKTPRKPNIGSQDQGRARECQKRRLAEGKETRTTEGFAIKEETDDMQKETELLKTIEAELGHIERTHECQGEHCEVCAALQRIPPLPAPQRAEGEARCSTCGGLREENGFCSNAFHLPRPAPACHSSGGEGDDTDWCPHCLQNSGHEKDCPLYRPSPAPLAQPEGTVVRMTCPECMQGQMPEFDSEGNEIGMRDCPRCEGVGWWLEDKIIADNESLRNQLAALSRELEAKERETAHLCRELALEIETRDRNAALCEEARRELEEAKAERDEAVKHLRWMRDQIYQGAKQMPHIHVEFPQTDAFLKRLETKATP